ncbi:hypothetical protein ABW19_dt0205194 [Dactylella cylindrospora]|nr:hypothetical protein ABW19_dt0205194 [Dactylella cylindrospora]
MRRVEKGPGRGTVGMVVKIEETMGNCPKYINARHLDPVPFEVPANLTSNDEISASLPQDALELISRSDMFFVSSRNGFTDMDTNHRGGPPGFVRVLPDRPSPGSSLLPAPREGTTLVWPEYSGNRFYQTLGNFAVTPLAGLTFPDYRTGDILYLTGHVEILIGEQAEAVITRSKLAVKLTVTEARYSRAALGIRLLDSEQVGWSPYNPPVRYLATEERGKRLLSDNPKGDLTARLIKKEKFSDTIARFTFALNDKSPRWKGGQYVMLNFEEELSAGYRHMDDSDPQGLNDDYIRSFTVSSAPNAANGVENGRFELTIRRKGPVTRFLFQQNPGALLEVPVQGFGGEFFVERCTRGKVGLVAAGVGITPFMAQWKDMIRDGLDVKLFWAIRADDLGFVKELIKAEGMDGMEKRLRLFVTGLRGGDEVEAGIEAERILHRRMTKQDLIEDGDEQRKWYVCAGDNMQKQILNWLEGMDVTWEDFAY